MKDKGVEELVSSARNLKAEYDNLTVRMVGPMESDYAQEFKKFKAEDYVELCGPQKDVHAFMKEANAVVVPSYHEGMSNVCLEAAACGRPLLASDIPGCREAFDDGVSGFGFEPCSAEDLQKAVERFINLSHSEKAQMGKAGREKMEKEFNRNIIVNKYLEVIENL